MSKKDKVTLGVVAGVLAVFGGGIVAFSQPPAPPGEGPVIAPAMKVGFDVVRGRVVAKDEQRRAIKVEGQVPAPPGVAALQAATWVTFQPRTIVRRVAEVGLDEVSLGDEISAQGLPVGIDARRIVIGELPEVSPGEGPAGRFHPVAPPPEVGKEGPPPVAAEPGVAEGVAPGMLGGRLGGGPPFASARGKVVNLQPLTIECQIPMPPPPPFAPSQPGTPAPLPEPQTVRITIAADEDTRVLNIVDSSFEDIRMGQEVVAAGRREPRGVLRARLVMVGVQLEQFLPRFGGLGGAGGPGTMFKFGRPGSMEPPPTEGGY